MRTVLLDPANIPHDGFVSILSIYEGIIVEMAKV